MAKCNQLTRLRLSFKGLTEQFLPIEASPFGTSSECLVQVCLKSQWVKVRATGANKACLYVLFAGGLNWTEMQPCVVWFRLLTRYAALLQFQDVLSR